MFFNIEIEGFLNFDSFIMGPKIWGLIFLNFWFDDKVCRKIIKFNESLSEFHDNPKIRS